MGRLSLLGDFLDDDAEGLTGASDINEHGHVVGAASKYPDEVNPFVWDATAGMQDLGGAGDWRWQPSRTRRVSTCTCRSRGSGRCAPAGGG
jgi:probable HAF family extracellular repeat protein